MLSTRSTSNLTLQRADNMPCGCTSAVPGECGSNAWGQVAPQRAAIPHTCCLQPQPGLAPWAPESFDSSRVPYSDVCVPGRRIRAWYPEYTLSAKLQEVEELTWRAVLRKFVWQTSAVLYFYFNPSLCHCLYICILLKQWKLISSDNVGLVSGHLGLDFCLWFWAGCVGFHPSLAVLHCKAPFMVFLL